MTVISRRAFLGASLCAAALPLRAQPSRAYPDGRPVRLIVPYTPGGGTDSVSRAIAAKITKSVGWTVVVENRPGAGGNIGLDTVAKAKPDGFVIGMGQTANLAINPALMAKIPFDASRDFTAIALVASLPVVLVVKADARWKSLGDLVAEARSRPLSIKQALAGSGTVGHLAGELLAHQARLQFLNVPYRGAAPALNDLLGNNTDCMFATPQAAQEMLKGKVLRPLAVSSRQRLAILPDVPTIAESGFAGFEATDWKALMAPAGTPADIVERINNVVEGVLADPETVALLAAEGSTALGGSSAKAQQFIQQEQQKWARLIRDANIKAAA
jgi:tripartite-type tricarboxylate transporter receptor subunit TctC